MIFLPYACDVVVFCLFLLFLLLFMLMFLFLVYLFLFCVSSVPLPGDMSFAGYFPLCSILSAFPAYFLLMCIWFDSVYLVTTAGFVANQSM